MVQMGRAFLPHCQTRELIQMSYTVNITVGRPTHYNEENRAESRSVSPYWDNQGNYQYVPDHVGDTIMTCDGYAEVVAVEDHACTSDGYRSCAVDEIALPTDYTEGR
jgi:hypothetical protein